MSLTRKIVLAAGVLLIAIVAYIAYAMISARSLSPAAVEKYEQGAISMQIEYCRPSIRERLIFGTAEEGALLPYGKYWRLGANDATKLTIDPDLNFGGQELKEGSYSLYAFPEEDHWVIGINTEADRSGSSPPDFGKDVSRIKVPVTLTTESLEQFTISIEGSDDQAMIAMQWDRARVEIPVKPTGQ